MLKFKAVLDEKCIKYAENKKASEFTTFRIGGDCFVIYPENENELITVISECCDKDIKYVLIGCGSNVLFPDNGYDGAVIMTQKLSYFSIDGDIITAGCGTQLSAVCKAALNASLQGLEFAYGIPGSLGGAVFMNAGAYGGEMRDVIKNVRAYSVAERCIRSFPCDECDFGYRHSLFSSGDYVILSADIILKHGEYDEIRTVMDDLINRRKTKQPLNYPSAGSAFKRYPGRYTGQMIEEAGLKGFHIGGAEVSEKHAGFIINKGNATCCDVLSLMDHIICKIREREGITIEPEIRIIR